MQQLQPNQLSHTAAFIAIKFYGLTRMQPYRSWFDDETVEFYERMVHTLPRPLSWYHSMLQKQWLRKFFIASEELLLPGDLMHIIARKYFIGRKVQQLLSGNHSQLLVLGAGFDHLATKWSRAGIPSFEIDTPEMASIKRNFIRQHGMMNPNLHIIDYHFSTENSGINLAQIEGLDKSKNTVIVAEGFFDYLKLQQCRTILEDLSTFFKNRVRLISTLFALNELSLFRRAVFRAGVQIVGEKIRFDSSKPEFKALLGESGFGQNIEMMDVDAMKTRLLVSADVSLPVLNGFYIVSASG